MSFDAIITTLRSILDVAIVWALIYVLLKNIKKNSNQIIY